MANKPVKAGGRPVSPPGKREPSAAAGQPPTPPKGFSGVIGRPTPSPHAGMPKAYPMTAELSKKLAEDHPAQAPHIRDLQARKDNR